MSYTNTDVATAEAVEMNPEICLMSAFEAAAPCDVRTPMGRLAAVCESLELALPYLTERCASHADLMAWSIAELTGDARAEVAPEAVAAERLARLREIRVVLTAASSMLETEAATEDVNRLCDYLSLLLEDVLRDELSVEFL